MNEPRFIELLNLYVDQQLSPHEAAELEAEIQKNPVRHRTYQQYCRMQKACAQLFEHERSAAPASAALTRAMTDADRKVVAFPDHSTRRSVWPIGFSVGAIAAAACVAFIVVRQTNTGEAVQSGEVIATIEKAPSVQAPVAVVSVATTPEQQPVIALASSSSEAFRPVFTVRSMRSAAVKSDGLFISVSGDEAQLLDWTNEIQLKPLRKVSAEELAFDQRVAVDKPVTTPFSTTTTEEPATEMTVIEFAR